MTLFYQTVKGHMPGEPSIKMMRKSSEAWSAQPLIQCSQLKITVRGVPNHTNSRHMKNVLDSMQWMSCICTATQSHTHQGHSSMAIVLVRLSSPLLVCLAVCLYTGLKPAHTKHIWWSAANFSYVGEAEAKKSSNTPLNWRDNWPNLMPLWGRQLPCVPVSVLIGVWVQLY